MCNPFTLKFLALFIILTIVTLIIGTPAAVASQDQPALGNAETHDRPMAQVSWYHGNWRYRIPVTIANPSGSTLTDYQVQVTLNGTFNFAHALANGSDLRVASSNGYTLIPFWIESWNPPTSASIWIKVPSIPVGGTTVYIYYGNPAPTVPPATPISLPPIGPFTKASGNPFTVAGAPNGSNYLFPENLIYDGSTYWVLVTDRSINPNVLSLVSSTDLSNWTYRGIILDQTVVGDPGRNFDTGHILQSGGNWYVVYGSWTGPISTANPVTIGIARSTTGILGSYLEITRTLLPAGTASSWENVEVKGPYLIQLDNGNWILAYTGDQDGTLYRVGIATSTTGITGPYTKSPSNPVLPLGAAGSADGGTVADPWVFRYGSTYYIGYAASAKTSEWYQMYATTTDWVTFTKSNQVVLLQGPSGSFDSDSAFRGAVTQVGSQYILPYTGFDGGFYRFGLATQPITGTTPSIINNPDAVFDFYDGFSGTQWDLAKWTPWIRNTGTGTRIVTGGVLQITPDPGSFNGLGLMGLRSFGTGYLVEAFARHPDANGDSTRSAQLGLGYLTDPLIRLLDYNDPHFQRGTSVPGIPSTYSPMSRLLDSTNFLLHRIYWESSSRIRFAMASDPWEDITSEIPTSALPPWLLGFAIPNQSRLYVDWYRIRKYIGSELAATTGLEQEYGPTAVVVSNFSARADANAMLPWIVLAGLTLVAGGFVAWCWHKGKQR